MKHKVLQTFLSFISKEQKIVKRGQKAKDNKLCREKCSSGPGIHNFTSIEIPEELNSFLKEGLKKVPNVDVKIATVIDEIENEVKIACKNLFITITGYFPSCISFNDSVDSFVQSLMIKDPNDHSLVSF